MTGFLLLTVAVVAAILAGLSLRLSSLVSTLLASYLAFVANLGLVTLVLSLFRGVDRTGLAVAQVLVLAATGFWWQLAGRPRPPLRAARAALAEVATSPVTLLFAIAVTAVLGYELLLGLSMPSNNWDGYTYHLARVAAWIHHGGMYWIPNAPTDRLNEFQPLSEQQLLFLFVATGSDRLYALPQFLAQLALLVAIYGSARRLGYGVRPAASSAFLFATFTLVALEASTVQNDLVAASFPAAAACLLLSDSSLEAALAGASAGIGLGAKLTTFIVWPVLAWLAIVRGRRTLLTAAAGAAIGVAAVGCWSYVLNLAHTGHVLGHGGGRVEHTASPSYPGSLRTGLSILYMMMDLANLWPAPIAALFVAGLVAGGVIGFFAWRRSGARRGAATAFAVALPFLTPAIVIVAANVIELPTRRLGAPLKGPGGLLGTTTSFFGGLNNSADENQSYFGPVGAVLLLGIPLLTGVAYLTRRIDVRRVALASALPLFFVVLSLGSEFNLWLGRFLIIPVALTAPLLATVFRGWAASAAYLVVAVLVVALALTRDVTKSLGSDVGAPWSLSRVGAASESQLPAARGYAALQKALPARGSVGAVLSEEDPSYLLGGDGFRRRVVYLPADLPVSAAVRSRLRTVVITRTEARTAAERRARALFEARGWQVRSVGGFWWLATAPRGAARPGGRAGR